MPSEERTFRYLVASCGKLNNDVGNFADGKGNIMSSEQRALSNCVPSCGKVSEDVGNTSDANNKNEGRRC